MIYLDADFLIHFLINQDKEKHRFVTKRFKTLIENQTCFISLLTLQEITFVLSKLQYDSFEINEMIEKMEFYTQHNFSLVQFQRAKELASKIGFQNINDCLHVAIAELYCKELYTFNKNDFERLKPLTSLSIQIF
jgi:predicted nucleic acid-binding protein